MILGLNPAPRRAPSPADRPAPSVASALGRALRRGPDGSGGLQPGPGKEVSAPVGRGQSTVMTSRSPRACRGRPRRGTATPPGSCGADERLVPSPQSSEPRVQGVKAGRLVGGEQLQPLLAGGKPVGTGPPSAAKSREPLLARLGQFAESRPRPERRDAPIGGELEPRPSSATGRKTVVDPRVRIT